MIRPHFVLRLMRIPISRSTSTPTFHPTFHPIFARPYIKPATTTSLSLPIRKSSGGRNHQTAARAMAAQASLTLSPRDTLLKLITDSFPNLSLSTTVSKEAKVSQIKLPTDEVVSGTNTITHYLAPQLFPGIEYSDIEAAEIGQWLTISALNQDVPTAKYLGQLNSHLKTRTTILGDKPSVADVAAYVRIRDHVKKWTPEERTGGPEGGYRYIVRWVDFVQNAPDVFGVKVKEEDKVRIDMGEVVTVLKIEEPVKAKKAEGVAVEDGKKGKKEKKAGKGEEVKEKAQEVVEKVQNEALKVAEQAKDVAAAAVGAATSAEGLKKDKKAKKEKAPKAPPPKKEETILSPSLIDLRVGQILKCVPHPNADSLYMSTVVCGDSPTATSYINPHPDPSNPSLQPTRTVLSGLRGKIPIEEMQSRKVVLVCNLKPANMRGIKSCAMVLAASPRLAEGEDPHAGVVELVEPPEDAEVGERVFFEGYKYGEGEPQEMLNSKQKIIETIQPGFFTTEGLEVAFDGGVVFTGKEGEVNNGMLNKGKGRLVTEKGGVCRVKTLKGALVR